MLEHILHTPCADILYSIIFLAPSLQSLWVAPMATASSSRIFAISRHDPFVEFEFCRREVE